MAVQPGFFDLSDRYEALSAADDPLERLAGILNFEAFRGPLTVVLRRGARPQGLEAAFRSGCGVQDPLAPGVLFPVGRGCRIQIKDRLSFQRFPGLGLDGTVPDATTVWLFRERLRPGQAIERLFARFDALLKERGYLAMGGQIIDATVVPAPKQRNTLEEKAAIKEVLIGMQFALVTRRDTALRNALTDASRKMASFRPQPATAPVRQQQDRITDPVITIPLGLTMPVLREVGFARSRVQ